MKTRMKKVLSLVAACVLSVFAVAQSVDSPWTGSTVESGKSYYIYNPQAKAFLTGANSWGTQASLLQGGTPFWIEGTGSVYTLKSVFNNGGTLSYLTYEGFCDGAASDFTLTAVDGLYTIGWENNYFAYNGTSNVVATVTELTEACYWQFLTVEDIYAGMANASASNPMNVTSLLPCANFGRGNTDISKWEGSPTIGGSMNDYCAEKWNTAFDVYQTITVPNGVYKISAQGFYRKGYVSNITPEDEITAVFYTNEVSTPMRNIMDEAVNVTAGSNVAGGVVPNTMADASTAFSAGLYQLDEHEVVVIDNTLTIGFKNDNYVSNDWGVFDNIQIVYCGYADVAYYLPILNEKRTEITACIAVLDSLGLTGMKQLLTAEYEKTNSIDETSSEAINAEISRLRNWGLACQEGIDAYSELGTLIAVCDSLVSQQASENLSNSIAVAKAVYNNTTTATAEDLVAAHKALVTARNLYRIENISTASFNFTTTATVGDWYLSFDMTNNVVRVNQYTGSKTDVVIPETFTYNGVEYVTVGLGGYDSYTWRYNLNNGYYHLKSVTLPTTLRFLGSYAFYYCQGLTEIQLPYGLKSIGGSVFENCTSLESLTIPASVTQFTGYDPFYGCSKLKTLRCEATVPPVCSDNFSNGIHVIYVPAGSGAAYEAATYWKDRIIVDGEGVSANVEVETPGTLGEKLLEQVEYLRQLNYLTVSGTLNSDDIYTIQNRLTGLLTIDMSDVEMAALPNDMFRNRYALQQVVLPNSLISIGQYAFYGCYNLQDMVLPATLKYIYTYAFCNCDNFEHVVIPEGVTTVGSNAFEGCDALQTVKWPSTTTTILNSMFYHSGLESIEIPEGVTTIGWNVFYGTNLAKLECPSTLTAINGHAFADCASLSVVKLNEGLTSLGEEAFDNCDALTSIVLPSTLLDCNVPFDNCNNIKTVTCLALLPPTLVNNYNILYNVNKEYSILYVPEWTINKYKLTVGWEEFPTIEPIKDYWPENIRLNQNFTLTLPDTLPADYKPHLLVDWNQGANRQSALTVNGNATLSTNTFGMLYDVEWEARSNGSSITHATLVNNAVMRADSIYLWVEIRNDEWSFLSFPFDVKVADIKPAQISTSVIRPSQENTNYVIRKYSGKERADANFSNTWQDMTVDSILRAGEGYIWQSSRYDNAGNWQSSSAFIVSAVNNANKNLIFANSDRTVVLNEYQSEFSHNRSWNLIGNPYPSYYDTRAMDFTAPITVWSMYNNCYYAYSPVDDEYILRPGEAFFVQRPVDAESITFAADGRQTDRVIRDRSAQAKAYTRSVDMRQVFNLTLSDGEMTDRTRFVINPDAACDYEMATDANKFMSSDARATQLYTIEGDVKFAISERPMADGVITLGAYFGSKGSYTIALDTKVEGISVILVDKVAGTETDLMEVSYTFTAEAGVADNRFEVCMRGDEEDGDTTGMDDLSGKVSVKAAAGQIAVTAPCEAEIEVYNAEGQRIATATAASAAFEVAQGVYVVKVQDTVHKVSVTR